MERSSDQRRYSSISAMPTGAIPNERTDVVRPQSRTTTRGCATRLGCAHAETAGEASRNAARHSRLLTPIGAAFALSRHCDCLELDHAGRLRCDLCVRNLRREDEATECRCCEESPKPNMSRGPACYNLNVFHFCPDRRGSRPLPLLCCDGGVCPLVLPRRAKPLLGVRSFFSV